jgi:hypothetical protein
VVNDTPFCSPDYDGVNKTIIARCYIEWRTYQARPMSALAAGADITAFFGDDQVYPLRVQWYGSDGMGTRLVLPAPNNLIADGPFLGYVDLRPTGDMWNVRERRDYDFSLKATVWAGVEYAVADHFLAARRGPPGLQPHYKMKNDRRQGAQREM